MKLLNMARTCLLSKKLNSNMYVENDSRFEVVCENLEKVSQYEALIGNANLINYFLRNMPEFEKLKSWLDNQKLIKIWNTLAEENEEYSIKLSSNKIEYFEELVAFNYKANTKDFIGAYLYLREVQDTMHLSKLPYFRLNRFLEKVQNTNEFFKAIASFGTNDIDYLVPIFFVSGIRIEEENVEGYVSLIKRMKETKLIDFFRFVDQFYVSDISTCNIPKLKDEEYSKIMNLLTKINLRANKLLGNDNDVLSAILFLMYEEKIFHNIKQLSNFVRNLTDAQIINIGENGLSFLQFLDIVYGGKFVDFVYSVSHNYREMEHLIEYALKNNKVRFIELIEKNYQTTIQCKTIDNSGKEIRVEYDFINLFNNSLLNLNCMWDIVNLNEINENDLKQLVSLKMHETKCRWGKFASSGIKLTPKEFIALHTSNVLGIDTLYEKLIGKVDEKLITIRQIAALEYNCDSLKEENLNELARKLSMKNAVKSMDSFPYPVSLITMLNVLSLPITFDKILKEAKNELELNFIVSGKDVLDLNLSLNENIDIYVNNTPDCIELLNALNLQKEFLETYAENIKDFCLNGNATIAMTYYRKQNSKTRRANLLKVVKATLANEMERFKFFDLKSEIEFPLDKVQENGWKENVSTKDGNMLCFETYEFADTMVIGERPTHSCMSYKDGSHNQCLLANFDSNKKIVYVKNGDKFIGRAIIRLTKSLHENESVSEKKVEFLDIDNSNQIESSIMDRKECLTIFLERLYSANANGNEINKMKKLLVDTIKSKAENMGARFIASGSYSGVAPLSGKDMKVFISKTKNDIQYMDSFGGSNDSSTECSYKEGYFYL